MAAYYVFKGDADREGLGYVVNLPVFGHRQGGADREGLVTSQVHFVRYSSTDG